MHKYFSSTLLFLIFFLPPLLINIYLSNHTHTIANGERLPDYLYEESYVLNDWNYQDKEWNYTLLVSGQETLTMIASDITQSFSVECNDRLVYQYDSKEGYQRLHQIPLVADNADGICELRINGLSYRASYKFLLGSTTTTAKNVASANGLEIIALGMYAAILIHSLSLYYKKSSEKYLLLLSFLALLGLLSYISSSSRILLGGIFVQPSQPIRYLRTTFSVVLVFRLCRIDLGRRWRWLVSYPGILLFTGIQLICYRLNLSILYDPLTYGLAIPAAIAVIIGCSRRCTGGIPLLVGTALRESLRIYNYAYNVHVLTVAPYAAYFYLPQLSNVIFAVACMVSIDYIFAEKFQQADTLAVELEQKVRDRTMDLQNANDRIQKIQKEKDQMTTGIYHDLRNPLFIAQGSAEMLEVEGERNKARLETIRNRLGYLTHLTEELFLLAKLEDHAITFDHFTIHLQELVRSVLNGFHLEAEKRNITLIEDVPEDLEMIGDSYHFKKVIENLVANAIRFTEEGQIRIRGWEVENNVYLTVEDTGMGIAPEELPHIFDRYYHGEKSSSGLGLYIVYQIVTAHGGTIDVKSKPGEGTIFTICLSNEKELS